MAITTADLVLEGGGVKGTGLGRRDHRAHRTPGFIPVPQDRRGVAGAIVASFVAAGIKPGALKQIMTEQDFSQFEDDPGVFTQVKLFGEGFCSSTKACSPGTPCTRSSPSTSRRTA